MLEGPIDGVELRGSERNAWVLARNNEVAAVIFRRHGMVEVLIVVPRETGGSRIIFPNPLVELLLNDVELLSGRESLLFVHHGLLIHGIGDSGDLAIQAQFDQFRSRLSPCAIRLNRLHSVLGESVDLPESLPCVIANIPTLGIQDRLNKIPHIGSGDPSGPESRIDLRGQ